MGYPNGGTKGPKLGKLFVKRMVCVFLFPLSDFSISCECMLVLL